MIVDERGDDNEPPTDPAPTDDFPTDPAPTGEVYDAAVARALADGQPPPGLDDPARLAEAGPVAIGVPLAPAPADAVPEGGPEDDIVDIDPAPVSVDGESAPAGPDPTPDGAATPIDPGDLAPPAAPPADFPIDDALLAAAVTAAIPDEAAPGTGGPEPTDSTTGTGTADHGPEAGTGGPDDPTETGSGPAEDAAATGTNGPKPADNGPTADAAETSPAADAAKTEPADNGPTADAAEAGTAGETATDPSDGAGSRGTHPAGNDPIGDDAADTTAASGTAAGDDNPAAATTGPAVDVTSHDRPGATTAEAPADPAGTDAGGKPASSAGSPSTPTVGTGPISADEFLADPAVNAPLTPGLDDPVVDIGRGSAPAGPAPAGPVAARPPGGRATPSNTPPMIPPTGPADLRSLTGPTPPVPGDTPAPTGETPPVPGRPETTSPATETASRPAGPSGSGPSTKPDQPTASPSPPAGAKPAPVGPAVAAPTAADEAQSPAPTQKADQSAPGGPSPDGGADGSPNRAETTELQPTVTKPMAPSKATTLESVNTPGADQAPAREARTAPIGVVPPAGSIPGSVPAVAAKSTDDAPEIDVADDPGERRKRSTGRRVLLGVLALLLLFYGAWAVDLLRTSGQVTRNTALDGVAIGGADRARLETVTTDLEAQLADQQVTVEVGEDSVPSDATSLGAVLDRDAIIDDALGSRRVLNPLTGPFVWVGTFFRDETVPLDYTVPDEGAQQAVADVLRPGLPRIADPMLVIEDDALAVMPGSTGVDVDPAQLAERLTTALSEADADPAEDPPGDLVVVVDPVVVEPTVSNAQMQTVADEANAATEGTTEIRVLDQTADVDAATLRDWVVTEPAVTAGDDPSWTIDDDRALEGLKPLFPRLGSEDQRAHFDVVDNVPIVIPASETVVCCSAESVAGIDDQLRQGVPPADDGEDDPAARTVELEPEIVGPDEGVAELEALGIIEEVSSFTTEHPAGQPRVTNIHRIADIVRGAVIRPGENFSLNGYVGRRTEAKGFVADGAIADGVLEQQVGGGVSQFATTFFNAAFFAGVDYNTYQSHSLYIPRYPRGREATISFPAPDLSIKNTTDNGILVWPRYTSSSITVTFYSTKHIEVTAGELQRSAQGECNRYTTPRTRRYPDGSVKNDSVFAVYRPAEGLDCNGDPTRPAPEPEPAGPTSTSGANDQSGSSPTSTAPTASTTPEADATPEDGN
ncbi:MAG: VanW family protein [Acidimicrobiales bacterium]